MKITKINRIIGFAVSMNLKFEVASRHGIIVNGYERRCREEDRERNCLTSVNIYRCKFLFAGLTTLRDDVSSYDRSWTIENIANNTT